MNFQTASYYNPPFTSFDQRLEDMRVTDSFLGITALRRPIINSIKTSYTYAWGSSVKVFKRTKFGTIIWYQVGTSGSTAPQGWIPVVYTAPNFLTSYFIGTPPNTAPCNGYIPNLPSTEYMTFNYNRLFAARYAIYHGYFNSQPGNLPGAGRVTKRRSMPRYIPFANFQYDFSVGTGSADFVSEVLWMGGLPMTTGAANSCGTNPNTQNDFGWRYCGENLQTSPPWDFHEAVIEYFTYGSSLPGSNTPSIVPNTSVYPANKGSFLGRLPFEGVNLFVSVSDGIVRDSAGLVNFLSLRLGWVASGTYPPILQAGDYVWINSFDGPNTDYHGLIVVGWAEPLPCLAALRRLDNTTANPWFTYEYGNIYKTYKDAYNSPNVTKTPQGSARVVPYVADYTNPAITQRPMPRPFYCTRYTKDGDGFAPHDWFFYRIPKQMHFLKNQLFVNPNWGWTLSSGQ